MSNETLIKEIIESNSTELLKFLKLFVRSSSDAEDLFQTGAIRALERAIDLKDPGKARKWLLSLYRNLALDFLRKKKVRVNAAFQCGFIELANH